MKTRTLAEVGLVLMAIDAAVRSAEYFVGFNLVTLIDVFAHWPGTDWLVILRLVIVVLPVVVLGLLAWVLIRYRCSLAARIVSAEDKPLGSKEDRDPQWEPAAYRLMLVFTGMIVLAWVMPRLSDIAHNWAWSRIREPLELKAHAQKALFRHAAVVLLQGGFGLWLVLRSPRLARWFVERGKAVRPPEPAA